MVYSKVKVPAIVGVIIAIVLAVLSALTSVPSIAPYVAIGITVVTAISGYLTPEGAAAAGRAKAGVRGGKRDGTVKHG